MPDFPPPPYIALPHLAPDRPHTDNPEAGGAVASGARVAHHSAPAGLPDLAAELDVEVPVVRTAAQARQVISHLLRDAGTAPQVEVDAHLVATELVTNANRHAGGVTGFSARLESAAPQHATAPVPPAAAEQPSKGLRISVEDDEVRLPRSDPDALSDPARWGGRGWALVLKLCAAVEIALLPGGGKRVSALVNL